MGGKTVGYYNISAASYGLQAGAQTFSYALFFMTDSSLKYLTDSGGWAIGSGPSVVVLDKGAAKSLTTTTLTQDVANTRTRADVEVDGVIVVKDVPVTYLLFLEKKLTDMQTFITHLPTLDPSQKWSYSRDTDCYVTAETWKYHTKKLPRVLEKAPATDKHPAQVEVYHEDVVIGYWKTIKFSGSLPAARVRQLMERVEKLQRAVKMAREEANGIEAQQVRTGDTVFGYLFAE